MLALADACSRVGGRVVVPRVRGRAERRASVPGPLSVAAVEGEVGGGARPRRWPRAAVLGGGRSGAGAPAPSAGYRPGAARARAEHSDAPPHITNISDASYVALAFSVALFGDAHTRCASRPFVIAPPGPSILAAPRASVLSGWLVLVGSGALVAGNWDARRLSECSVNRGRCEAF